MFAQGWPGERDLKGMPEQRARVACPSDVPEWRAGLARTSGAGTARERHTNGARAPCTSGARAAWRDGGARAECTRKRRPSGERRQSGVRAAPERSPTGARAKSETPAAADARHQNRCWLRICRGAEGAEGPRRACRGGRSAAPAPPTALRPPPRRDLALALPHHAAGASGRAWAPGRSSARARTDALVRMVGLPGERSGSRADTRTVNRPGNPSRRRSAGALIARSLGSSVG